MSQPPLHTALDQLREIHHHYLASRRFRGFSGAARGVAGVLPAGAALVLTNPLYPRSNLAHFFGWLVVGVLAFLINYSALMSWYFRQDEGERDGKLIPVLDTFPPLILAVILTFALVSRGHFDLLFGLWMCLYGQIHLSCRHVLPPGIMRLGVFYMACGATALFFPPGNFLNPWPMALIFLFGETIGAVIFYYNRDVVPASEGLS